MLKKATCDAVQYWEMQYTGMIVDAGFRQVEYSACVFYREQKNIRVVVHGDDFAILVVNRV